MNKKQYRQPATLVVALRQQHDLLVNSNDRPTATFMSNPDISETDNNGE